jgi:uncharacterized protein (UPF0179 family)
MDNFIEKLKLLIDDFSIENCTESCNDCKLNKVLIEFESGWDYISYDICDLLTKIKENI